MANLPFRDFLRRSALAETENATWLFEFKGFFNRRIKISTVEQDDIGNLDFGLWGKAKLTMNNGFEANFYRDSVFNPVFSWDTLSHGRLVQLKQHIFSFKKISISIDANAASIENTPLLCFLGTYLIILRRRRKAAAH